MAMVHLTCAVIVAVFWSYPSDAPGGAHVHAVMQATADMMVCIGNTALCWKVSLYHSALRPWLQAQGHSSLAWIASTSPSTTSS